MLVTEIPKIHLPMINIETTNICPANCLICPRKEYTQKRQIMDMGLFAKIITECKSYNVQTVDTCGFGDPFADRLFFDRCKFIKEVLPFAKIYASSTCYLLDEKKWDNVARYVDILKLSIYGTDAETYEHIHGIPYEKTMKNILGFIEYCNTINTKIYLTGLFVEMEENKHQTREWKEYWEPKLDEIYIWKPHNWVDYRNYRVVDKSKQISCGRPLSGPPYIHVDGTVSPCCWDINKRLAVGNIVEQSLWEILHSERYDEIRNKHKRQDFSGLICENCCQTNVSEGALVYTNKNRRVGMLAPDRGNLYENVIPK